VSPCLKTDSVSSEMIGEIFALLQSCNFKLLLALVLGFILGYFFTSLLIASKEKELNEREEKLTNAVKKFRRMYAEFKEKREKFLEEKESLENTIEELKQKKDILIRDILKKREELENLKEEIEKLQKEKERILQGIDLIIKGAQEKGYREGYQRVIQELRSLRAQKSAILDLFDKYPELEEFLKEKEGLGIRKYLEKAKKKGRNFDGSGV